MSTTPTLFPAFAPPAQYTGHRCDRCRGRGRARHLLREHVCRECRGAGWKVTRTEVIEPGGEVATRRLSRDEVMGFLDAMKDGREPAL